MLKIKYAKLFLKQYKKLSKSLQLKTKEAIKKFSLNPKDNSLKPHKLSGDLKDYYSFSVDYKFRVVFEINKKDQSIWLLKVGNHDIYK